MGNDFWMTYLPVGGLLVLTGALFIWFIYALIRAFRNEKIAKVFRKNMKVNDKCYCSVTQGINAEVIDPNPIEGENFVKVSILIRKHLVYPENTIKKWQKLNNSKKERLESF